MNENVDLALRDFLKYLGKRVWVVVLCAALLGTSVLIYTKNFVKPQYEASVSIYVNNNYGQDGNRITSSDLQASQRLVAIYITIIQSDAVLDKVIKTCGVNLEAGQLRDMISAKSINDTEIFEVTVKTTNPELSRDLANVIAEIAPGEIAGVIEGCTTKIIDTAKLPKSSSSPNYVLNTVLGVMIGAVLAIIVLIMRMLMDTRIKSEEDISKICKIPVMGVIPNLTTDGKKTVKKGKR